MSKVILATLVFVFGLFNSGMTQNSNKRNPLNEEEQRVILDKGTERAFTGEYVSNKAKGIYICKYCDAPLYNSNDKFDSHCGWPSFDDEIPGAVNRQVDADGMRTEILCANCGGHLGHVFVGEHFTSKNERHCVNSISLKFVPSEEISQGNDLETAIFAGGCFWGMEYLFKSKTGVKEIQVGYTGGHKSNPTYEEVCAHLTGHAEAMLVKFDPDQVSYRELAKLFFEIHDPTQVNRQGPDIGNQYRSEVFYTTESQKRITQELISTLEKKGYKVATKVTRATTFWLAESFHQDYYGKTGGAPYCHVYTKRF